MLLILAKREQFYRREAPSVLPIIVNSHQAFKSGRLTQEQLDTAFQAQQHTGHPLWRTVMNLGLLTPQEMTEIIKALGPPVQGRPTSDAMAESPQPGQAVVPQSSRDAVRRVIEVDDTATTVVHLSTSHPDAARCPSCAQLSSRPKAR